ncbi:uncharacterized protein I206_103790 [Kwoniella pini CBS 10737]|uniref:Major facilitator superfamily (MFS) profile domain-containing protein n=1 Tax=Kwoniella pini CBS 10737 TaxID=1296096 RepID=A0A1B9HSL4_9TREE|nr:uncharacterized protein I206_07739 [Kwoniella pini CBS 10737]OCF46262.1 hypothetical protein I206_07739 [Kwoniella pini CBS 10737]
MGLVTMEDQATRLPKSKLILLCFGLQIALFLSFIDSTSVSTILPIVGSDLNATNSITWAGTAFLVANTSFQIITSRLSDCFGRKIVLMGSLSLFAIGDLLAGFARNKVWLYCARAVAGIGGGGINSLSMIIMSDVVTLRERGQYQSLLGIGIAMGSGVGPFLGAVLAEKVTWRWTFWIIAPLSALTMLLIQYTVPLKPVGGELKHKLAKMDWIGSILSLAMTICILVPLSGGGSTFAWNSPIVISLFVVGGLSVIAFIVVERYFAAFPLFPGRLLLNRNVCLLLVQTWLVGMVYYGGIFFVPLYLQNVQDYSPILSAALLLPLVLGQVLTTTISGYVVKFTNRTWASFFVGFVLWTAGQGAQLCFGKSTTKGVIIGCLILQGFGIGSTIQSTLVLAQASGLSGDRAVITGVRNFARTSGGAIGLAIGNSILQNVFLGHLPEDLPQNDVKQLADDFGHIKQLSETMAAAVREAYMQGIRKVFIFFVPVVAICLFMCTFIKDLPLDTPSIPILPTENSKEPSPECLIGPSESDGSSEDKVQVSETSKTGR